jgi:hypothetical protein
MVAGRLAFYEWACLTARRAGCSLRRPVGFAPSTCAQVHRIIGHIVHGSLALRSVTGLMLIGCALLRSVRGRCGEPRVGGLCRLHECACALGCACVEWGRGIGRIDFRASPNANRPDSCARMQAAHREKQNPQSRKPRRLTHRIDRMDRPPMHATGCGRFRLVGRHFPQVHTIRPARPRRRQLASTHCCRTRRVRRIASLCCPPRVAGPSRASSAARRAWTGCGVMHGLQ